MLHPHIQLHPRQRGAAFVEAVLVISALTLALTGLVFFRDLYLTQLGVQRLARASVMAHSLAGCKGNAPRQWLGRDLGAYVSRTPREERAPTSSGNAAAPPRSRDRATRLLGASSTASSDGQGVLNPITSADLSGSASVTADTRGARRANAAVFSASPRARSYVSCGEEVKQGDYDELIVMIKDEAQSLFSLR